MAGILLNGTNYAGFNTVKEAGFTPVGTIISLMGKTAPDNYLICDGTVYNISTYPELANYFKEQFEASNYFGGDGVTTFAVPDLRGEFLRGTGTNGHANQGNGAGVGKHQNATEFPAMGLEFHDGKLAMFGKSSRSITYNEITNSDKNLVVNDKVHFITSYQAVSGNETDNTRFTSRPTNTSVLYCIAVKDIYITESKLIYDDKERVVGSWFGKPLYQKTIKETMPTEVNAWTYYTLGANIDFGYVVSAQMASPGGIIQNIVNGYKDNFDTAAEDPSHSKVYIYTDKIGDERRNSICIKTDVTNWLEWEIWVTVRYTKTTD